MCTSAHLLVAPRDIVDIPIDIASRQDRGVHTSLRLIAHKGLCARCSKLWEGSEWLMILTLLQRASVQIISFCSTAVRHQLLATLASCNDFHSDGRIYDNASLKGTAFIVFLFCVAIESLPSEVSNLAAVSLESE